MSFAGSFERGPSAKMIRLPQRQQNSEMAFAKNSNPSTSVHCVSSVRTIHQNPGVKAAFANQWGGSL